MNSLLDNDTEDDLDDRPARARDREITLGTTMVLGIFFALAAYGAVLFGFGYSMGAKHNTSSTASVESGAGTSFGGFKPAPGSPLGSAQQGIKPVNGPTVTVPDTPVAAIAPASLPKSVPAPRAEVQTDAETASTPAPAPPTPRTQLPAAPPLATTPVAQPTAAGSFLVQVAAVSHQEDADLLVVTLKRRGYAVAIHHESQDSLLHVQIGNFVNKKDAEAMRQRLLADGFNAIVK